MGKERRREHHCGLCDRRLSPRTHARSHTHTHARTHTHAHTHTHTRQVDEEEEGLELNLCGGMMGAEDNMPHLRFTTQPFTPECVRNLIALSKNMPDEVRLCVYACI